MSDHDDRPAGGGLAALVAMMLVLFLLAGGAGAAFYFSYGHSRAMRMEAQMAAEQARMAEAAAVAALEQARAAQANTEAATAAVVGSLVVSIQADGQVQANGQPLATEALVARLNQVGAAKGSVTLYASPDVPAERLAAFMQQAREAGVSDVRLSFSADLKAADPKTAAPK
jgi:biopolymer transport protein ExbD